MTGRDASASARDAGFTLLEVLGAVLIFVAAFAVLVGTSGELIQRVSTTEIRLEASEIAERELARLEASRASRQTPPEDREEQLEDGYTLRLWSEPAIDDLGGAGSGGGSGGGEISLAALTGGGMIGPMIAMHAPASTRSSSVTRSASSGASSIRLPSNAERPTPSTGRARKPPSPTSLRRQAATPASWTTRKHAADGDLQDMIDQIQGAR